MAQTQSKIKVGKLAFTANGACGAVKKVAGDQVTIDSIFGEVTGDISEVSHQKRDFAGWRGAA